nr:uncharacterized protein CTRU02_04698 [Colletotrichum truncatum]KAF6795135.1 hypothetical protein CTRU02_04698 [Colletotrichum truncatum]
MASSTIMASEGSVPTRGITRITSLPPELLMRIIGFTHPSAHLDLACTCRVMAQCSSDVLRQHQEAHKQRVVCDRLPSTVPDLLRRIIWAGDGAIFAWHVRSFEFWGTRSNWDDWRPYTLEPPIALDQEVSPLTWSYAEGELEEYMRLMKDELHMEDDHVAMAKLDLEGGRDGILKLLVIALSPHLRSLKHARTRRRNPPESSLHWLTSLIENSHSKSRWSPGLQSLREVAIGVDFETVFPNNLATFEPELLASLFKLPRIDSINFNGLLDTVLDNEDTREDDSFGLTVGCSTVQHLFLQNEGQLEHDSLDAILKAPRALKSLAICGSDSRWDDVDQVVSLARQHQKRSLESLMMYHAWGMHGYRCVLYHADEVELDKFSRLRQLHIDEEDIDLWTCSDDYKCFDDQWSGTPEQREAAVQYLMSWFPTSLQVLSVGGDRVRERAAKTETWLIRLIESRRCPDLKVIYLEDDRHWREWWRVQRPHEQLCFQRLIEVGERHGVDIVSASAGNRERIHQVEFPAMPDLVSRPPRAGARDSEDCFFNVFTGSWTPKGCGYCGNCARCFEIYTREAWQTRGTSAKEAQPGESLVVNA